VDVRVAEEAEVDREEEGMVPPCGGGSGGEAAREVRRAWAWRSVVEGSGGGEDSTGRGGKMGPEAGGVPGRDRESWTVTGLDLLPEKESRRIRGARTGDPRD
jgi:hypothetical protein